MPLETQLLKKCIDQAKNMDSDAAVNELTESERLSILRMLTEAIDTSTSLKDRLRLGTASDVSSESDSEMRFRRKLMEEGFLAKSKDPSYKPVGDRTPIIVKGKAVSEIIIEERR